MSMTGDEPVENISNSIISYPGILTGITYTLSGALLFTLIHFSLSHRFQKNKDAALNWKELTPAEAAKSNFLHVLYLGMICLTGYIIADHYSKNIYALYSTAAIILCTGILAANKVRPFWGTIILLPLKTAYISLFSFITFMLGMLPFALILEDTNSYINYICSVIIVPLIVTLAAIKITPQDTHEPKTVVKQLLVIGFAASLLLATPGLFEWIANLITE